MSRLTTGELARQCGVNLETIHFYERQGLLPKPPRTGSGYRMFPSESARRVRFIKSGQELGFTLREIGELLALRFDPETSCGDVRRRAEEKLADVEQRIGALCRIKFVLTRLAAACPGRGAAGDCPILGSLDAGEPHTDL